MTLNFNEIYAEKIKEKEDQFVKLGIPISFIDTHLIYYDIIANYSSIYISNKTVLDLDKSFDSIPLVHLSTQIKNEKNHIPLIHLSTQIKNEKEYDSFIIKLHSLVKYYQSIYVADLIKDS